MLPYDRRSKLPARRLRSGSTDAERALWLRIRRKQIHGVQVYRQKPLGHFIVDFYAPAAHLVIEVDGGQHFEEAQQAADRQRTSFLNSLGLHVLRFDNLQVLTQIDVVLDVIEREIAQQLLNPS